MPKKGKASKRKLDPEISALLWADVPLAQRTKKEEEQYKEIQEISTEINEAAWVKAVKLVKEEWDPFPPYRRCYVRSQLDREWGMRISQNLVLQFKSAVLSHNWTNAVKLAVTIFKNFHRFNERIHLQVLLGVLMSHPQVDEELLTKTCSFLWQMEKKDAMAELLRCFCSMPKELPHVFLNQNRTRTVFARAQRDFKVAKSPIDIRYTAHIVKSISDDNDMYVQ